MSPSHVVSLAARDDGEQVRGGPAERDAPVDGEPRVEEGSSDGRRVRSGDARQARQRRDSRRQGHFSTEHGLWRTRLEGDRQAVQGLVDSIENVRGVAGHGSREANR